MKSIGNDWLICIMTNSKGEYSAHVNLDISLNWSLCLTQAEGETFNGWCNVLSV